MHVETHRILNKIETSAQASNVSAISVCPFFHAMATMAMRASLSACTTSAANLKIWCNFPSSTHSKCISSRFAATFLHSHCWTRFMKVFSSEVSSPTIPRKKPQLHVEGDPYHDSSNPQSAEWFPWRHLQPVISPDVFEFRKLKTKCQKKSEKRLLFWRNGISWKIVILNLEIELIFI